jgi:hypothetical protein
LLVAPTSYASGRFSKLDPVRLQADADDDHAARERKSRDGAMAVA